MELIDNRREERGLTLAGGRRGQCEGGVEPLPDEGAAPVMRLHRWRGVMVVVSAVQTLRLDQLTIPTEEHIAQHKHYKQGNPPALPQHPQIIQATHFLLFAAIINT